MLLILLMITASQAVDVQRVGSAAVVPRLRHHATPAADDNLHAAVDKDGVLWLCEPDGLVRYDPETDRWSWLRPWELDLPGAFNSLRIAEDDALWVGTNRNAVARIDASGWRAWTVGPWDQRVAALHALPGRGVLVQQRSGLYALGDEGWHRVIEGNIPGARVVGHEGELWLGWGSQLHQLSPEDHGILHSWDLAADALSLDERGVWVGTHDGLYLIPPGEREPIRVLEHPVDRLTPGPARWAAGGRALWRIDGDDPIQIELPSALATRGIWQLLPRPEAGIWALNSGALGLYRDDRWTIHHHVPPASGLSLLPDEDGIWALAHGWLRHLSHDGTVTVSIDHDRLAHSPPRTVDAFRVSGEIAWLHSKRSQAVSRVDLRARQLELRAQDARQLAMDREGRAWIAQGAQVLRWARDRWAAVPLPPMVHEPSMAPDTLLEARRGSMTLPTLLDTSAGSILVSRPEDLLRWTGESWEDLGKPWRGEGRAWSVEDGPDETLWVGGATGLYRWDGLWTRMDCPLGTKVTTLRLDSRGDLWVAATDGVAVRRASGDWELVNVLAGRRLQDLVFDGDGNVLVSIDDGPMLRLDPDTLALADAELGDVRVLWVDEEGRRWMSSGATAWWERGGIRRDLVSTPQRELEGGGALAWTDGLAHQAQDAAAWFADGRWYGKLAYQVPSVALVGSPGSWHLLLASGELLSGDENGRLRWDDPPAKVGRAMIRWQDALCVAGDGLACQRADGGWQRLTPEGPFTALASTQRQLLAGGERQACRLNKRGRARCVAVPSPVQAIVPDKRGGAWLGTDQGVLFVQRGWNAAPVAEPLVAAITGMVQGPDGQLWAGTAAGALHERGVEGWKQVWLFDDPVTSLVATDSGLALRAGEAIYEVTP